MRDRNILNQSYDIIYNKKYMNNLIEKYTQIYWSPFLTWVFMGVNAIKDSALFVDWPDCVFYKADMIFNTHDIWSKLKDPSINTKLYFSWVMPNKMVRWYDDKIKKKLSLIERNPKFNLGVVACMPVTWLLATQYENIYSDFQKDFVFVPSFTDKFWLDGYSIFLKELAKKIKLDKNKEKTENHISVIWFLFDRNEWDVYGNIEEIKRILSLIWVTLDCMWLDGNNYVDLKNIESSQILVSLPYWLVATKILAKKLWTDYISTTIPFWLSWTIKFIEDIWEKLQINEELIKKVIFDELKFIKEKTNLLDENFFLNKHYIYAWDPFLENGINDIWEYFWLNHIKSYYYTGLKQAKKEDILAENIDLVIWNAEFKILWFDYQKFEFGFPSYNKHFLLDRPYMWFRWFLNFTERLYDKLSENCEIS